MTTERASTIGTARAAQEGAAIRAHPRRTAAANDEWSPFRHLTVRTFVLIGLLLSYIWRFHDLHPILRPLRLAAIFSVSSWLLLILTPNWRTLKRALRLPFIWLLLVWTLWMFIGLYTSIEFERTWSFLIEDHLKSLALLFFVLGSADRFRNVVLMAHVHVAGALVLALFYAKGGFPTWGAPVPMYDVNDLALLLCIALPLAFRFATMSTTSMERTGGWLVALLLAFSIVATRSRGAFITLIVIAAIMLVRFRGVSVLKRVAPIALIVVGFFFASENARTRLATIFSLSEDYNLVAEEGRIAIWTRGLGYMFDHPLLGVGAGNFSTAERMFSNARGMVAHNSYVEVGAETGVVGLLLLVSLLVSAFASLYRLRTRYALLPTLNKRTAMCDACTASLTAWIVGAFFLAWGYSVTLYAILAMIAGLLISDVIENPIGSRGERTDAARSHG